VSDPTVDPARRAQGLDMFTQVSGFPAPQVHGPFMEVMVDQVFAEVWNRPGLTRKERRWISLTCVAAAGIGDALAVHVGGALSSGDISIEELREFVTHFAAYAGYPKASLLHTTVERVWSQRQQTE
jgi:4-carboxymuconolactone decarboxylase